MFGKKNPEKMKDKLEDMSQELAILTDQLKTQRAHELELIEKIREIATNDGDFNRYVDDITEVRKDEVEVCRAGGNQISDPRIKDAAIESTSAADSHLKDDEKNFDEDEAKIEEQEQQETDFEKQLEQTTKKIIEIEEQIKDIEEESTRLTEDLEAYYDNSN